MPDRRRVIAATLVGAMVLGGGGAALVGIFAGGSGDAPNLSLDLADDEIVADYSNFTVSDDRRSITVTSADPVVPGCTEPVGLAVAVGQGVAVLRPVFRRLGDNAVCEQACDTHRLTTRLERPLDPSVTVVADPDRVEVCA